MSRRTWMLTVLLVGVWGDAVRAQVFTDVAGVYGVADTRSTSAAIWLDYDNDGDLDLLAATGAHTDGGPALFRNDGDGFVDVAASVGLGPDASHFLYLSAGDLDNDWRKMNCLNFVFLPKAISSRERLDQLYGQHVKRFYSDPGWRKRFRKRIWEHRKSLGYFLRHLPDFLSAKQTFEPAPEE